MSDALPIACTLTPEQLRNEGRALLPGLAAEAAARVDIPDGIQLRFDAAAGRLARITEVIDRERVCCRFLRFTLRVPEAEGAFELDVTGPAGTRELLEELLSMPATVHVTRRTESGS